MPEVTLAHIQFLSGMRNVKIVANKFVILEPPFLKAKLQNALHTAAKCNLQLNFFFLKMNFYAKKIFEKISFSKIIINKRTISYSFFIFQKMYIFCISVPCSFFLNCSLKKKDSLKKES